MAQEPAPMAAGDTTPATVKCNKCGNTTPGQCPQAVVAAAVGFQQGFQMGFDAGLGRAALMMQGNGNSGKSCACPHHRCAPKAQGAMPAPKQPAPQPEANPA